MHPLSWLAQRVSVPLREVKIDRCLTFCYGTNDENLIDYLISFLIGSIILMAYFLLNSDVTRIS